MSNTGITSAVNNTIIAPASRSELSKTTAPRGVVLDSVKPGVLTLTKFETKCLQIQLSSIESNIKPTTINIGPPTVGTFQANINANTVVSWANTYFSNVSAVSITNSDHSQIKLGMVANVIGSSTGAFGANTMVIKKSVAGNITAGNFIPGFTYRITSIGTTNFTACGLEGNVANVVIGNVFVANSVGSGTGTAFINNNQILLGSDHTVSGDITFNVSPLRLGKYQTSEWLLTRSGYKNPDGTWKDKDGVDSNDIFISAPDVQDQVIDDFIKEQYAELIKAGAIREGDSKDIIAGMLALAYQYQDLGNPALNQNIYNSNGTINLENYSIATKCNVWRNTGQTVDSQGRPGHIYFNGGRYAIRTLGADVVGEEIAVAPDPEIVIASVITSTPATPTPTPTPTPVDPNLSVTGNLTVGGNTSTGNLTVGGNVIAGNIVPSTTGGNIVVYGNVLSNVYYVNDGVRWSGNGESFAPSTFNTAKAFTSVMIFGG